MAYGNNRGGGGNNPTHQLMIKASQDQRDSSQRGRAIYPVKMFVNIGKGADGDEFDRREFEDLRTTDEKIEYLIDHITLSGTTQPKRKTAKDQTHPIDAILRFVKDELGNNEMYFRIMPDKYKSGGGYGGGRGGSYGGRGRDDDRGGRDDYDDRPQRRGDRDDDRERDGGRDRNDERGRDSYDDRPRSRGERDDRRDDREEPRGKSRSQRFDPPARDDRDFSRDDDDPFADGN